MRALVPLLLLVLFAVPAVADHVYTHRFVVSGRLVDASGAPVAGVEVEAIVDGASSRNGECDPSAREIRRTVLNLSPNWNRTNAFGDFEVCVHAHGLRANSTAGLRVGDELVPLRVDRDARIAFASRTVAARAEPANASAALLVRVRVWEPSSIPLRLDGVAASGSTMADRLLHVTLRFANGTAKKLEIATDPYGDAAAYVPVPPGASGTARVAWNATHALERPFGPGGLRVDGVLVLAAYRGPTGVGSPPPEPARVPGPEAALALAALGTAVAARRVR